MKVVITAYRVDEEFAIMYQGCDREDLPRLVDEAINKGAQMITIRIIRSDED